jgi:4a-hydroxytetrahydrobiopterin dehydratase
LRAPPWSRDVGETAAASVVIGSARNTIMNTGRMSESDGWDESEGALERTFTFASFREALDFVNRVGELAEAENHHPDIRIDYKRVTLRWWTHTAGGITERDRDLAEKTSALA